MKKTQLMYPPNKSRIRIPNSFIFNILFVLTTAIPICAKAQTRFGVLAGANFSKLAISGTGSNYEQTNFSPGLQIGITLDIPLQSKLFFQPGLSYIRKGFKVADNGYYGYGTDFKVKADYLELPLHLIYKQNLGKGKALLGAGPYLAYGTGGTWKSPNLASKGDIIIGNRGDVIFRNDGFEGGALESYIYGRPFDYGLSTLLGYEFNAKISFQVEGKFGLANLQPDYGDFKPEGKVKNTTLGLSVGYKF